MMEKTKNKTGTAEIITQNGRRFLRLVQIFPDGSPKTIVGIALEMPELRTNTLQKSKEKYTKMENIA